MENQRLDINELRRNLRRAKVCGHLSEADALRLIVQASEVIDAFANTDAEAIKELGVFPRFVMVGPLEEEMVE